ncbi:MAG: glycosyltransferase [Cyanobacteria bacterium J06648_16]
MKVAVVHEWFTSHAGSEKVVEQILQIYPQADLFSLVDFLSPEQRAFIQHKSVQTSFIQTLPFARKAFRQYLPLMPLAIEQFDLSAYDVVISSSHAVAKGIVTAPHQLHISYVHTPIRYAWELQHQYLQRAQLTGLKGGFARLVLHYLRLWDRLSADRVDRFVANSKFIAGRIRKTYRRSAEVIYPPVEVDRFRADQPREDFYLVVSRFVPYKRVDLIVSAFNQLGLPLVVIGDGPQRSHLHPGPSVTLLGTQPDTVVADYLQRCKAFVFAAEEDFGITPVEAQAAGAPVIAYERGGACETVASGTTGILFPNQTVSSLVQAVKTVEAGLCHFDSERIRQHAVQFSAARFQTEFQTFVEQTWLNFCEDNALEY